MQIKNYLRIWLFFLNVILINDSHAYDFLFFKDFDRHSIQPKLYVGVRGGLSGGYEIDCDVATNRGYFGGIVVGYQLFPFLRLEGDGTYQSATVRSRVGGSLITLKHVRGDVQFWSCLGNVIFDVDCQFPVKPYIGAGLGYGQANGRWSGKWSRMNEDTMLVEQSVHRTVNKSGFAWQGIIGLRYSICHDLEVDIEYRFFRLENKLSNHTVGFTLAQFF